MPVDRFRAISLLSEDPKEIGKSKVSSREGLLPPAALSKLTVPSPLTTTEPVDVIVDVPAGARSIIDVVEDMVPV